MTLRSKSGARVRTIVLAAVCVAVGAAAGPGVAHAAVKAAQDVFVTNTADNPVPVTPQGTTQVAGTVTVANQPSPPAAPTPIQIRLAGVAVTHDHPTATETVFNVPEGKILTVEFAELYFSAPHDAYNADLRVDCTFGDPDGLIDESTYHLPEIQGPNLQRIFGGPMRMLVPAGACLVSHVTVVNDDIGEGSSIVVHGSITGYLSDAPGP